MHDTFLLTYLLICRHKTEFDLVWHVYERCLH